MTKSDVFSEIWLFCAAKLLQKVTLSVFFAALSYDKIRQIQPPVAPSVTTDALDIFMRGLGFGQTTVETFSVSMEHIFFAGIDIIRRAMFRQLLFVYHEGMNPAAFRKQQ